LVPNPQNARGEPTDQQMREVAVRPYVGLPKLGHFDPSAGPPRRRLHPIYHVHAMLNEVARVQQFRESLRALSDKERDAPARELGDDFADSWEIRARDEQLPPPGDWWCWVLGSRRGFGKTRSLSGAIHHAVRAGYRRIHLVAPSFRDVIDVMVDGPRRHSEYRATRRAATLGCKPPPRRVAQRRNFSADAVRNSA